MVVSSQLDIKVFFFFFLRDEGRVLTAKSKRQLLFYPFVDWPHLGVLQSLLRAGFVHFLFILNKILALMTFTPGVTPMNILCYMGKVTLPL